MNKSLAYSKGRSFFLMFLFSLLLVRVATAETVLTGPERTRSTNKAYESASSSATYFYVDPSEVRDIAPTGQFLIKVDVNESPPTYAWEILLNFDPTLLEWFYKLEGDFLKRGGAYTTTFTTSSYDTANLQGAIRIVGSLQGAVPVENWASGNGELCRLGFKVKTYGSSVLNLSETGLWDREFQGSPAETYYPNQDGFFYNQAYHDIALINVTVRPTIVEPNGSASINVTIRNEGNFTETSGTFNVTVYADKIPYEYIYDPLNETIIDTKIAVGDEVTVGTQTSSTLDIGANTTLIFTWNAAGIEAGNYTISAKARRDDDLRDNLLIDGRVTIKATPVHDIAITSIVPTSDEVAVGQNVTINVTAENEGTFDETFNVTLYYDGTIIATKTGIALTSGSSTTLPFTWVTAGISQGTYTIKAEASAVEGETNTANNTFTDGTVEVKAAQGSQTSDILPYVFAAIVITIAAVIAIYIIRLRRRARR